MNYAFTSFSCPDRNLPDMLAWARQYGYSALEIRSGARHSHGIELGLDPDKAAAIAELCANSGITLHALSISCHYSDPATVQANIEQTEFYIRLAEALNIPLLRVFCGIIPPGLERDEARRQIAGALKQLAPQAASAGIKLVVETHDA